MKTHFIVVNILLFNFLRFPAQSPYTAWHRAQQTIRQVDSAAVRVKKQKLRFKGKRAKFVAYSPNNRKIKVKRRIRYKNDMVLVFERYRIRNKARVYVYKINGQTYMLKSKYKDRAHEEKESNTFTRIGDRNWQWTYSVYTDSLKYNRVYLTKVISNWQP